ncbi:MAG: hypothetical protein H6654_15855 [Ardenticatenaceae bacterium]|nr:hypothetical protein [Ardenticatenaceae bacterium]MCB8975033.1 hypothetical protein [Ardenticatenaceae bacterium]
MATRRKQQTGCVGRLMSLVAALLLLLGVGIVALVAIFFLAPERLPDVSFDLDHLLPEIAIPRIAISDEAMPTLVSALVLPSPTPTETEPPLAPTWTPLPVLPSATPLPFSTLKPSVTPSPWPTFPTKTLTPTHTPTPTNTPTATPLGPTPTPSPTRSAFIFTKTDNSPFYLQNHANNAGCGWLGIAGEVLDLNLNPVSFGSYRVHVWGSGIDERVLVGNAPDYGPSGWEQFVFDSPVMRDYNVQLETPSGTAVSQIYHVQTKPTCDENLLQINFVQNH